MAAMMRQAQRSFTYQDSLRAVGAWLDVRGYREVRIIADAEMLVIEAARDITETSKTKDVITFDVERIQRLRQAALHDRGAPRALPAGPLASREIVTVQEIMAKRRSRE